MKTFLPFVLLVASGCSSSHAAPQASPPADAGHAPPKSDAARDARDAPDAPLATCETSALMDFTGTGGFYGSPFPSDARLTSTGVPDVSSFPKGTPPNALVASVIAMVASGSRANGFGVTSSIYFDFTGPLRSSDATALDDPKASLADDASVFIMNVDPGSPAYGQRSAARGLFLANGGPYGAPNLLAVLPFQGVPLLAATRYAAVVLRTVHDAKDKGLCAASQMTELVAGKTPKGMSAKAFSEWSAALETLSHAKIAGSDVAAMTVFTTETPTSDFEKVQKAMLARPLPQVSGPWTAEEVFPTYCVFQNTLPMPDYQAGTPPYSSSGGGWVFDTSGEPIFQRNELANIFVTIPRAPMPANGYPIVDLSRTGVGGNRPLVDRGQAATNGGPAIVPGSGPALYFAAAGFAGASIDGPLGGLRNPVEPNTDDDEDSLIFNVGNPIALRDNIRESSVELSLTASILSTLRLDASSCPGATTPDGGMAYFDSGTMALMSHSMGSTISPLTLAFEPRYRAAILSGAGGSWTENIIYKLLPLDIKPAIEVLLGIHSGEYSMGEGDPVVNMFQWAAEPADAPVYDSRTVHNPVDGPARDVLKVQGIIDHYILPPICNATSLSLGLDLAGPALDGMNPGLSMYAPLMDVIFLSGRGQLTLPVSGNVKASDGSVVTAVVTQHPSDGIEDGHEVIFQTDPPKHEYVCLLQDLAAGRTPRIPVDGPAISPCE